MNKTDAYDSILSIFSIKITFFSFLIKSMDLMSFCTSSHIKFSTFKKTFTNLKEF